MTDNFDSPEQLLQRALKLVCKDGSFQDSNKMLILALNDDGHWCSYQTGMTLSESVTVCEVAKTDFIEKMGHMRIR